MEKDHSPLQILSDLHKTFCEINESDFEVKKFVHQEMK